MTKKVSFPKPPVLAQEIFGWCCFDFANSSFTTVIITVVFAPYFVSVIAGKDHAAASWWGETLALSQLFVVFVGPWIGARADAGACKKKFLMCTAIACSALTACLFFTMRGNVLSALLLVGAANVAFSLSENLCAGFLPEISTPKNVGRISSYGWSFGYMGGLCSLLMAWCIVAFKPDAISWLFPLTGAFFLMACTPTLLWLRERAEPQPQISALQSWRNVWQTACNLKNHRALGYFFISFTFFMSGLMAIISFASLFAEDVLHFTNEENIILFAMLQISGAVGALIFGVMQDRVGAKSTLVATLILWLIVSALAVAGETRTTFFITGGLAGLGIGSIQSASRAVVSSLIPPEQSGEFFGFWGFFGKLGAILGPLIMGLGATFLGFRMAVAINALFFFIAILILLPLNLQPAHLPAEQR